MQKNEGLNSLIYPFQKALGIIDGGQPLSSGLDKSNCFVWMLYICLVFMNNRKDISTVRKAFESALDVVSDFGGRRIIWRE
jgi:hypothetical protein